MFGQLAEWRKRRAVDAVSLRDLRGSNPCPPSKCSGGATGRRVRLRAALLRVRISPRTPQARSPTRQRQHAQTVSSVGSNPTEPTKCACSPTAEATRSKRVKCWFESSQAHQRAPVADGEASGFQTRDWVFESPLGCQAPQQQVASGRVATSVCAVRFRGGAPSFFDAEEWTSC